MKLVQTTIPSMPCPAELFDQPGHLHLGQLQPGLDLVVRGERVVGLGQDLPDTVQPFVDRDVVHQMTSHLADTAQSGLGPAFCTVASFPSPAARG
jgi:hypothetical protein